MTDAGWGRSRYRRGFCRAEFLVVAGVVVMIAGIAIPLWAFAVAASRVAVTGDDTLVLVEAMERYVAEHDRLPLPVPVSFGDIRLGDGKYGNRMLMNILRAVDGPGNYRHQRNPEETVYIEVAPYEKARSGLNRKGEFLDPWGQPYQIVIDADGDGVCRIERSRYQKVEDTTFGVWSHGPDRTSDTDDDIRSWTLRDR